MASRDSVDARSGRNAESAQMESFQSILKSLNIPDPTSGDGAKITPEMMNKLSEHIMSILGDDKSSNSARSGITDDGLPIVEITEPEDDSPLVNDIGEIIADDLVRHDLLSPEERARRIADCNRLLDELEGEEREEEDRERINTRLWVEQKKRESAERAASMSKTEHRPQAQSYPPVNAAPSSSVVSTSPITPPAKKKSVRFSNEDTVAGLDGSSDLVFARLKKQNATTTANKATLERLASTTPMKLEVVERAPGKPSVDSAPPSESRILTSSLSYESREHILDSDDETPPSTPSSSEALPTSPARPPSSHLSKDDMREIEDEYQRRRQTVTLDPEDIDISLTGESGFGSGTWDEEFVPLDATLASSGRQKPAVSRFKASRIAIGESVSVPEIIPSGAAGAAFRNTIRLGRLKGDELQAAAESDSDEDIQKTHAATFDALKNYGLQTSNVVHTKDSGALTPVPAPAAPAPDSLAATRRAKESSEGGLSNSVGSVGERAVGEVRERAPPRRLVSNVGSTAVENIYGGEHVAALDSASRPKKQSRFKAQQTGQ